MSLKDRAITAYQDRKAQEAVEAVLESQEQRQQIVTFCVEKFGVMPDILEGDTVIMDGLRMAFHRFEGYCWFELIGPCPDCGQECHNDNGFDNLADLGLALSKPFVAEEHGCPALLS